jgi:ketosteroid isomerase-like protein
MSQENVEIVRWAFAYEMYGRGDRAQAADYFAPDFVMNTIEEGAFYGLDSIRDNIEHWASAWEDFDVIAEEFLDAGDQVVVTARHRGRGRASGVIVDARFYEVYTLRDGKITRADEYADRAEALEAAGLQESAMSQENVEVDHRYYDALHPRCVVPLKVIGPEVTHGFKATRVPPTAPSTRDRTP